MPCLPARARELLKNGKAAVYRRYPFTLILTHRAGGDLQPIALKLDPGAKETGLALVASFRRGPVLVWAGVLTHRSGQIKAALDSRRGVRRSRRHRHCRYRQPRFDNRRRPEGWLPPSLQARVEQTATWARRLQRYPRQEERYLYRPRRCAHSWFFQHQDR